MKPTKRHHRHGAYRRVIGLVMLMLLCMELLPVTTSVSAAGVNWTDVKPTGTVSAGNSVQNTYIFEVSSGTRQGGGAADNVLFFSLTYTTADGLPHTAVLMPGEGAVSDGFDMASAVGNRDARRSEVERIFGYTTAELRAKPALGSVQTDQIMFTTQEAISSVEKIQIFGKRTGQASDWACQGMRLYRVDTLYGLEMYGWYSDTGYIDFEGELIARVKMPEEGCMFRWDNSGGMFDLTPGSPEASLDNQIRLAHHSQSGSTVTFRMDLADVAGAGFEALAGAYSLGSKTKVGALSFCECAALTVRYQDTYGCIREIVLPLVINALGQAMETLGEEKLTIAEYAQQGDSIAMSAMLPDFREIESVNITLGAERAATEAKLRTSPETFENATRRARVTSSATDEISYICFAAYSDVSMQMAVDGAKLRCRFIPGEKNPIQYSTATSLDGIRLTAGSDTDFTLQSYYNGMTLSPSDRMERYLVTISTDNVANAGTTDDVYLKFRYVSMKDKEVESAEYAIRDYVRQFYGDWPGNVEDFAYQYGLREGGTVQFILPLQGVKEFKDVALRIEGNDEWQFTGLSVAMVRRRDGAASEPYGVRMVDWQEIAEGRLRSHVRCSRSVETNAVCFEIGKVFQPEEARPKPTEEGSGWTPGTLIQDDDTLHIFDGESREVTKKEDVDWARLRNYMTYEDTQQNLGFLKERFEYEVLVQVAGKTVNPGNDDCGSKNLFYFRLIFENGTSGFTQANQQVQGDAFRTGAQVRFKIPVTQDYGELTEIQVIPDSQDGNSDIYDKLQIEYISVTRAEEGSISPTWTAKSSGADGLGWVGIDYRDPGEMGTNTGAKGRSLSELATTYQITETSYSANLLVSITTGAYDGAQQFTGGLAMSMRYFNTDGKMVSPTGVDAVAAMNDYSGRTGSHQRTYTVGTSTVTEEVDYEVSNPDYQFRPGSTDSFLITVKDVYQLADMSLSVRSNVVTDWTITAVNVYQVNGQGKRIINANGAYDYVYPEGQGLKRVATWTADSVKRRLSVYDSSRNTSVTVINFALDSSPIELSPEAKSWSSRILPEPPSHDDTLNLLLYPTTGKGAPDPSEYEITAAVQYTNVNTRIPMQISTGQMRRGEDDEGNPVFYALGLSANDMDSLDGVTWTSKIARSIQPSIDYGVVQRVRGGVLIETYPITGLGGSMYADTSGSAATRTQRVLLQVSERTQRQTLSAGRDDLAVALYFRTGSPFDQEYRSKYIFLTDLGYSEIRPGQMLALDFNLGNVEELTAVNLVTAGKLDLTIRSIWLADLTADGTVGTIWGSGDTLTPGVSPMRVNFTDDVTLLTLVIKTADATTSTSSGTNGPIRMTLGCYDKYGEMRQPLVFEDIRVYADSVEQTDETASAKGFMAGGTAVIKLLLSDFGELRWIELEPWHDNGETAATWMPSKLSAVLDLYGNPTERFIDQLIVEGEPLHVGMAEILISGTATIRSDAHEAVSTVTINSADGAALQLSSGQETVIEPRLMGSDSGWSATLEGYDPATGSTSLILLDETHSYTAAYLAQLYASAHASMENGQSATEREAAKRVVDIILEMQHSAGTFSTLGNLITFRPPRNYTGRDLNYRITVASDEDSSVRFTVDVKALSETDPLPGTIELWVGEQERLAAEAQAAAAKAAAEAAEREAAERAAAAASGGNGAPAAEAPAAEQPAAETPAAEDGGAGGAGTGDGEQNGG